MYQKRKTHRLTSNASTSIVLKLVSIVSLCIFAISSAGLAAPKKKTAAELRKDLEAIKKSLDKDKNAPKWLRIEVKDLREGAVVKVNLPLKAVIAFLEAGLEIAQKEMKYEMKEEKNHQKHEKGNVEEDEENVKHSIITGMDVLRKYPVEQWIEWFKEVPNGEIVTVDSKDAKVRIWVE